MQRSPLAVVALAALLMLGACADGDSPAPTAPHTPSLALGPALAACDPSGIRQTMASLYPTNVFKQVALPRFNSAEQWRQAGNFARARSDYFAVIDDLILRYRNDVLLVSSQFATTHTAVHFVVASTLACAGDPEPDGLALIIEKIAGNLAVPPSALSDARYQICPILNVGASASCVVPSRRAAVLLPAGFLQYEALVLMQPDLRTTDPFATPYGSTWSGRWRIRVTPPEAQTNLALQIALEQNPATPIPPGVVTASAAFCAEEKTIDGEEFHAPPGGLRVAHVAEASGARQLLPRASDAALFALLAPNCQQHTNQVASAFGVLGDSYAARHVQHLARTVTATLSGWLAPRTAYAFDGGAGGSRLVGFRSYFAAVEEPALFIRDLDQIEGTRDTVPLGRSTSLLVYASRTRYGTVIPPAPTPLPAAICTWSSSHNRVTVSPTAANRGVTATLTTSSSTGDAMVHAVCSDVNEVGAAIVRRDSMLVRVIR